MRNRTAPLALSSLLCLLLLWGASPSPAVSGRSPAGDLPATPTAQAGAPSGPSNVYLPLLFDGAMLFGSGSGPRINAPYFPGGIRLGEMAIAWFGRVDSTHNYVDIRTAYNAQEIYVNLAAFDRRLWYDTSPTPGEFAGWDSASLYLSLDGNRGEAPGAGAYRFDVQLRWDRETPEKFQAGYQGSGSGWSPSPVVFTAATGWQGNAPNDNQDDRGWVARIHVPFTSLGLAGAPSQGVLWGMAILLYDRDTSAGSSIPLKTWPAGVNANRPDTWGGLRFGVPAYQAPPSNPGGTLLIRQGENGASVVDGEVGGGTTCGNGLDFWNEWGDTPAPGGSTNTDFNIQNQGNIADWPCFSKVFINFPLGAIPPGKVIRSARLVLHEFGSSDPANAKPSYIQVLAVADNWDEASLTWNNAPLAVGNFVGAWVDPTTFPGWPGIRYEWDVSLQTSQAYAAGDLLRLALYSADGPLHSGKYFVSSHTGDWNKEARPTLIVEWGNP